jgi:hypothetical protein
MEGALRFLGYSPGFPPLLPPEVRAIDHEAVALVAWGAYGCRGGLECRPWHGRRGGYRIVATCLACGAGEEV